MNLSSSLRLLPLAAALSATGCLFVADPPAGPRGGASAATEVSIDADATMTPAAGQAKGVFVETTADGRWSITTTCDTPATGARCAFDVLLSTTDPALRLSHATLENGSGADRLEVQSDGSIHWRTATGAGLDGVVFDAGPGVIVAVDLLLDGVPQPALVHWVSAGASVQGAPSNPVTFAP